MAAGMSNLASDQTVQIFALQILEHQIRQVALLGIEVTHIEQLAHVRRAETHQHARLAHEALQQVLLGAPLRQQQLDGHRRALRVARLEHRACAAPAQLALDAPAPYDPSARLSKQTPTTATITGADATTTELEVYAFGDFNRDGTQDALLRTLSHGAEGNWFEMHLWLATTGRDGDLALLEDVPL